MPVSIGFLAENLKRVQGFLSGLAFLKAGGGENCSPLLSHEGLDSCIGVAVGVGVLLFSGSSITGPAVGVNTAVSYDEDDDEEAVDVEKGLLCQGFCKFAIDTVRPKL
jgi:hypothetical protein